MINVSSKSNISRPFSPGSTHKESFPIITTYNPREAKITSRTFSIQMLFPCSLRPHIEISKIYVFNYYVAGELIASKHSYHSTALQLIRFGLSFSSFSYYSSFFFIQHTEKNTQWRKTLFDGKVFFFLFAVWTNIWGFSARIFFSHNL